MNFQGAVVREQNVTFGIVVVKPQVLQSDGTTQDMIRFGRGAFGNIPIVLMAQNSGGRATFRGRPDIVKFLSHVSISRIPWREYTVS